MDRNLYAPMLAHKCDGIFDDDKWRFEPKIDGIRCIAYIDHNDITLVNRSLKDVTEGFPETTINLRIAHSAVIDGELCIFEEGSNPVPNFQLMQTRMHRKHLVEDFRIKYPATFVGFDLLEWNGKDICNYPLADRKDLLEGIMGVVPNSTAESYLSYPVRGLIGRGKDMMDQLVGWEGVMAKLNTSKYTPGLRSKNWLKIKPRKYITAYVLGCTGGIGKRLGLFGALVIGINNGEKYFTKLGYVGTGFTDSQLVEIKEILDSRPTTKKYLPPYEFVGTPCEPFPIRVSYIEKTRDGSLRFPVYEGRE